MKRIAFFLVLLASISFHARAQSVREKALIVNNAGDTLHGWIAYKNWRTNPVRFDFFPDSVSKNSITYQVADIRFFDITGHDQYIRAIISKDNRPVELPDLLPPSQQLLSTDTVWLRRLLYDGKVELYLFTDFKNHFYIHTDRGYAELDYRVSFRGSNMSIEKGYIKQLKMLLEGTQPLSLELLNEIDKARYREPDLVKVVKKINEALGSSYVERKSRSKVLTSFFTGVGGGYSSLGFSGYNPIFENMEFSGSFAAFATAGLDISAARNLQDLVFRLELAYTSIHYKGFGEHQTFIANPDRVKATYELKQTNIAPSIAIIYNFLRNDKRKVYAGAGMAYHFAFYDTNRYFTSSPLLGEKTQDNYLTLPKSWMGLQVKLGYKIADKWEIGLNGQLLGTFTNYVNWSLKPNTYTAQLRYFF